MRKLTCVYPMILTCAFFTGCVNLKNSTVTGHNLLPVPHQQKAKGPPGAMVASFDSPLDAYPGLRALNIEVGNIKEERSTKSETKSGVAAESMAPREFVRVAGSGAGEARVRIKYVDHGRPILSKSLREDAVLKKILSASAEGLKPGGKIASQKLGPFKLKRYGLNAIHAFSAFREDPAFQQALAGEAKQMWKTSQKNPAYAGGAKTVNVSFGALLGAYTKAYLDGNFVDRNGTAISQPEIGTKIGNDTITGFETVLLEALYDYSLMTPVLHAKQAGQATAEATAQATVPKKPSFAEVYPELYEEVKDNGKSSERGVSEGEYDCIRFLSKLSAEQSKHLSALLMRLFGGATASFVIGGKLSVGDNDTLSKIVSTLTKEFADRISAEALYRFFEEFRYDYNGGDLKFTEADETENMRSLGIDANAGQAVLYLIEYHSYLEKLLPSK